MPSPTLPKQSAPPAPPSSPAATPNIEPIEAPPRDPRQAPTSRDSLAEIGRLIRGEPEPEPAAEKPAPDSGKPKPKSLDDAAKALGLTVAELYELDVPLRGEGKDRSVKKLGELKDYFSAQDDHSLERLEWEERRDREQASVARERAELAELLSAVPRDKLDPRVLETVRKKIDATISAERRKTLDRIPQWGDDNTRTVELTGIAEHLADYGFPASALQGITDHRMLAYMRDNWLRMTRLQTALEKVKQVRTPQPGRAKANTSAPEQVRDHRESARSLDKQVDAVSKLLRG